MLSRVAPARARLHRGLATLATRKQKFKEESTALRDQDPGRWTVQALARHFDVPLENVRAMLALQDIEADRARAAEPDPELVQLAVDAEEYLDVEYAQPAPAAAPRAPSETFYDHEAPPPSLALGSLGIEQDGRLVAAATARFGASGAASLPASLREVVGGLTPDELAALLESVAGGAPRAEGADAHGSPQAELLAAVAADEGAAALLPADSVDLASHEALRLPTLPPLARPRMARAASAAAPPSEFWTTGPSNDALAARPEPARTDAKRGPYDAPDDADKLQRNLEARHRNLNGLNAGAHAPYRNEARLVITEVTTGRRGRAIPSSVWVAEKASPEGVPNTREPTADEHRSAVRRIQPPNHAPRTWRNK